jgi:ferredoxin
MGVNICTQKCVGCRSCEIACAYHHKKVFSRIIGSIKVARRESEGEFDIVLYRETENGRIACDNCGFCLKYCPDIARDELKAILAGEMG